MGAVDSGKAEVSEELLGEHEHLGNEGWVQATRMASHSQGYTTSEEGCIIEKILG